MINVITYVPFIILILGIIFTLFGDFSMEYIKDSLPLYVGVALSFVIEELLVLGVDATPKK